MAWLFAIGVLILLVVSRRFRILAVALVALAAAAGGLFWAWTSFQNRPQVVNELDGIRLGMSTVDVRLAKGAASTETATSSKEEDGPGLDWQYRSNYGPTLLVNFEGEDERDLRVWMICEAEGYSKLFGLGRYSTEEEIAETLGAPPVTSISADALKKTISYPQFQVGFELSKGNVQRLCIVSGSGLRYVNEYSEAGPSAIQK